MIPTLYGRLGDEVYVHGSSASRMLRTLDGGVDAGRWAEARPPTPTELKATSILRLPLDQASAKVRTGPRRTTRRTTAGRSGPG
jgi:hypothetical protein